MLWVVLFIIEPAIQHSFTLHLNLLGLKHNTTLNATLPSLGTIRYRHAAFEHCETGADCAQHSAVSDNTQEGDVHDLFGHPRHTR